MRNHLILSSSLAVAIACAIALPASAATWQCDYVYDGDVAERRNVEADSEAEAQAKLDALAISEGWSIDFHLGCTEL
ncbi:hypothetical protein RZA67_06415 [Stenotrophomonas sp. C3(2023)]|uniref:hypothetical protein n=1 Tax=Stenotrophomonas sp. C3(2023) TaxID=3080277 RepID=UPI00293D1789|nr:hypothetical protein [Stenotrophomonas sp. C3(2023)]MDV3468368.1 hypothetical protein [Stenotrophomonas sp. C3(2023)]